jgi:hypothetical protein
VKQPLVASDLFAAGWLSPRAAAAHLGISLAELEKLARKREIRRKAIAPGVYLFDVGGR